MKWHGRANALVLVWLAISAGLSATAALGSALPAWLGVHTLLLGAATTAIVVWSEHFAVAVTHSPEVNRRWSVARLATLTSGQVAVVGGVVFSLTWLLAAGAVVVAGAVAAHGFVLLRLRRKGLRGQLSGIVDYYLAACFCLVAGAVIGGLMGSGLVAHSRLYEAHVHLNLGGWVALTVVGTLFMLLPTTLRTRMDERTVWALHWCLRLAAPGLLVAVTGLLLGLRWVAVAGLLAYLAGLAFAAVTFAATVRRKRPDSGSSWMLAAATGWLVVAVVMDLAGVAFGWPSFDTIGPVLLVGVVAQVLIGSLTYLLPVVLSHGLNASNPAVAGPGSQRRTLRLTPTAPSAGSGPASGSVVLSAAGSRAAASARLDRWWPARLALFNAAVVFLASGSVSTQEWLTRAGWLLAALVGGDFLVRAAGEVASRLFPAGGPANRSVLAGTSAGVDITVLAVLVALSGASPQAVTDRGMGTGTESAHSHGGHAQAQIVDVRLVGMRVDPPVISVPRGTNLTLRVSNMDSQPHDLRTETGKRTSQLRKGETAMLALGQVNGEISAWCTVAGHRAAGMRLSINTSVQPSPSPATDKAYEAGLAAAPTGQVHRVELAVVEKELEVAPGVRQKMWTFNGSVPGPALRGKIGDTFEVTLLNNGSIGHGIDFHAGALAPDGPMRTIQPGERLVYRFHADRAGVWMYHCSTAPMTQHIGAGMFGAVIIDPPDLATVDREYLLVASELYYGDAGDGQAAKLRAGTPDGWAFNGMAHQYDNYPLTAKAGERVRFWLLNAGPGGTVSFHIVGTQFYTTYLEGAYLLRTPYAALPTPHAESDPQQSPSEGFGAAQTLALATAQGGFVETVFPEAGSYSMVDHDMRHAEGGSHGTVTVK